jgi:hypothetical protein
MQTNPNPQFAWHKLAAIAAACCALSLVGCQQTTPQPPAPGTDWSGGFRAGSNALNSVGAVVDPVGPPRWCYTIESFDSSQTNTPGPIDSGTPMPGNPHGHPDGISFTNIDVSAPHCTITNVPSGWTVKPGSSFVLTATNNYGSSKVQFCLICDATNGTVSIKMTDRLGNQVIVGPIAGPQ